MAVQKRRRSKARVGWRRSSWMASVKKPQADRCPKCEAPRVPHRVCMECGHYDGRKVLDVEEAAE